MEPLPTIVTEAESSSLKASKSEASSRKASEVEASSRKASEVEASSRKVSDTEGRSEVKASTRIIDILAQKSKEDKAAERTGGLPNFLLRFL